MRLASACGSLLRRAPAGDLPEGASRSGAVVIQWALVAVAVIAFVSLGSEVVLMFYTTRQMQSAADAGALAAVTANIAGATQLQQQMEAKAQAASAGFVDGAADGTSVQVLFNYNGMSDAIKVAISQPQTPNLLRLITSEAFTAGASAAARINAGGFGDCVLALNTTAARALDMTGVAKGQFTNCDVAVNSSSSSALRVVGTAQLTAGRVDVVGGVDPTSKTITPPPLTGVEPTENPYQSPKDQNLMNSVLVGPCLQTNYSAPAGLLPHGTYCNGLTLNAGMPVTLESGIYVINNGVLKLNGGASLTSVSGTNVTIVLTGDTPAKVATVNIQANSTVNITAPTSGAWAGLAFFQDPKAKQGSTINGFGGGNNQQITGILYFPNQNVTYGGGSTATLCTRIIADTVSFSGNAYLNLVCGGTGVGGLGGHAVLIE